MLRAALALTLLLNLLVFAFTQGWLDGVSKLREWRHLRGEGDAARLQHQLHPEQIALVAPQAVQTLQARACLEYGPLKGDEAFQAVQAQLEKAGVPAAQWQDQRSEQAGVWAVATIRFPNKDFQQRKEETYKRLHISYEYLSGPAEEMPSMLLSRHASEKAANAAVDAMSQRALKGLRVLQLQAATSQHQLRFAQADGALRKQLDAITALGAPRSCVPPATAPASASASAPASSASAASGAH